MRVSVVGGGTVGAGEKHYEQAQQVGELLAERGHTVVCGGRGGVMEAVCKGASEADGRSIGILPGTDRSAANPFLTMAIATGMGNARNPLVALNGEGAIAINGATGTLSEIGHALDFGRPVAGLGTHEIRGVEAVGTPKEAVSYVESQA
jgi:uncharacterized protein (TIGR00725 family)